MAIYKSYSELKDTILTKNDSVIFDFTKNNTHYRILYAVNDSFLSCKNNLINEKQVPIANSAIFDSIHINDRYVFASEIYGYESLSGNWPTYKILDYKGATNLVLKLYSIIEDLNFKTYNIF